MEVLRITLRQSQANYRMPETVINKMTYPLPPFSTVIGALHQACGYKEYHPMDLSIQGRYGSMRREAYMDSAILNSVMDDRGILIKLANPELYGSAYVEVAKSQKTQGNSFRKEQTVEVLDRALLDEYQRLLDTRDRLDQHKREVLDEQLKALEDEKKTLQDALRDEDSLSEKYLELKDRIKEKQEAKKALERAFKEEKEREFSKPYAFFATLTKSLRFYEVLYDVELVLHISSSAETLAEIERNIPNLRAIGRSEDFVDVTEFKRVSLKAIDKDTRNHYASYLDAKIIADSVEGQSDEGIPTDGTRYYLPKVYRLCPERKKRLFDFVPVVYMSEFTVGEGAENVYLDEDEMIVSLL